VSLITPSVRRFLPLPILDILDDQEKEVEQVEFWTPAVEAAFWLKIRSISGTYNIYRGPRDDGMGNYRLTFFIAIMIFII
jgi:hypothetical protein